MNVGLWNKENKTLKMARNTSQQKKGKVNTTFDFDYARKNRNVKDKSKLVDHGYIVPFWKRKSIAIGVRGKVPKYEDDWR